MKLNHDGVLKQLSTQVAPIYLIEGSEPLLVEECSDAVHAALKKQGFTERCAMTIDTHFNLGDLLHLTQNFSLFAEKKRIQLNCAEKMPTEFTAWLTEYCQHVADYPDLCLIIKVAKLGAPEKKAKWLAALEKVGVWVTLYDVALQDFARWLDARLFQAQLKLTPDGRAALIEQTEGNLLAAAQSIKKLSLLGSTKVLTLEDLEPLLSEDARYDLFDLSRHVLLGDLKRALRILDHLQHTAEPVLVLWVLSKELKTLLTLHTKKGKVNQAELYRSLQIWDKRIKEVEAGLRRLSAPLLATLLAYCADIDLACKGLKNEDPWEMFKILIVKMGM